MPMHFTLAGAASMWGSLRLALIINCAGRFHVWGFQLKFGIGMRITPPGARARAHRTSSARWRSLRARESETQTWRPDVIFSNHQICTCTMRELHGSSPASPARCAPAPWIYNIYIYIPCSFVDRELEYEGSGNWNKNGARRGAR